MKRTLLAVVGFLVVLAVANVVKNVLYDKDPDVTSREFLTQVADEVNRTLPMMVDQDTQLMSVTPFEGRFAYNYRLVNWVRSDLDVDSFIREMTPQIKTGACTNPETRTQFLDKGVSIRYSYVDQDSAHVADIDVLPADCSG